MPQHRHDREDVAKVSAVVYVNKRASILELLAEVLVVFMPFNKITWITAKCASIGCQSSLLDAHNNMWNCIQLLQHVQDKGEGLLLASSPGVRPGSTIMITKGKICSENLHHHHCQKNSKVDHPLERPCSSHFGIAWDHFLSLNGAFGHDQQQNLLPHSPKLPEASYSDQIAWKAKARCSFPAW